MSVTGVAAIAMAAAPLNREPIATGHHMGIHQELLPGLVRKCAAIHPECAVVLIGSVARGAEREGSDIDLQLLFPGDERPVGASTYVADDNRWQLQLKEQVEGVRIDVAWETEHALWQRLRSDEAISCWPLSRGTILHDPADIARPCLELARQWFAERPEIAARFEQQYTAAKRQQRLRRGQSDTV
ncbi:MAG: nucleotidyltransferase domain-containing protein [Planctomycetales bacterium]|nr:nucleotidyltransferase domain-containing protein [Planctomycetales bacterium]